jgi:hypothetical protein
MPNFFRLNTLKSFANLPDANSVMLQHMPVRNNQPRDRCYIFKKFHQNILRKKLLKLLLHSFCKKLIIGSIGFWEKRHLFRRKLAKLPDNCDQNIDPWMTAPAESIQSTACRQVFAMDLLWLSNIYICIYIHTYAWSYWVCQVNYSLVIKQLCCAKMA